MELPPVHTQVASATAVQGSPVYDEIDSAHDEHKVIESDPTGRFERYDEALGKGAYKEVFKAFDQEEGVEVAWNQLRVDHLHRKDAQRILYEIQILQSLRNDNIINLFHSWVATGHDGKEKVCFITELMTSGTLKSYIRKTKGMIKPKILRNWAKQVLNGLEYLHSRTPPIIHRFRDLKCENIFINGNNGQAKIGDLGLATIKHREHVSSVLGTPEFMAPELYDEKYDEKVDIYAFGMVLLEIVTKEYPYSECSNQAQIYKKVTSGIKPTSFEKIQDEETKRFIEICTAYNPQERPSAIELLKHPFLTSFSGASSAISSVTMESLDQSANFSISLNSSFSDNLGEIMKQGRNQEAHRKVSESSSVSASPAAPSLRESFSGRNDKELVNVDIGRHTYLVLHSVKSSHLPESHSERTTASQVMSAATKSSFVVEVEKSTEDTAHLKMIYSAAGKKPQEIKFPFSLKHDTVTDVVTEMVNESLIQGEDESMARRKIEEIIRQVLISSRDATASSSSSLRNNFDLDHNIADPYQSLAEHHIPHLDETVASPASTTENWGCPSPQLFHTSTFPRSRTSSMNSDLTRGTTISVVRAPSNPSMGPPPPELMVLRRNSSAGITGQSIMRNVSPVGYKPRSPPSTRIYLPPKSINSSGSVGSLSRPGTPKQMYPDQSAESLGPLTPMISADGGIIYVQQQYVPQERFRPSSPPGLSQNLVDLEFDRHSPLATSSDLQQETLTNPTSIVYPGDLQKEGLYKDAQGSVYVKYVDASIYSPLNDGTLHKPTTPSTQLTQTVDGNVISVSHQERAVFDDYRPVMMPSVSQKILDPQVQKRLQELQELNLKGFDSLNLSIGRHLSTANVKSKEVQGKVTDQSKQDNQEPFSGQADSSRTGNQQPRSTSISLGHQTTITSPPIFSSLDRNPSSRPGTPLQMSTRATQVPTPQQPVVENKNNFL